jgi:hypothetical protein
VVEPVETTVDKNRNSIKYGASTGSAPGVPAWIAQAVCCRKFCAERIFSLDFFVLFYQEKRTEFTYKDKGCIKISMKNKTEAPKYIKNRS